MHQTASPPLPDRPADTHGAEFTRNAWYAPFWFKAAGFLTKHFPHPLTRRFAATVGDLGWLLCRTRRAAVECNVAALTDQQSRLRRLSRSIFANFLRMLHDYCDCAQGGPARVSALVSNRRGFEFLEAARRNARGTLLVTGHLGAWELGGMVLAADGFPVNVVTLEEPTPELNAWRHEYRQRFGIKTITVGKDKFAFVEIIQALRRNELVAMLVDRPYLNSGVAVQFLGRPTLFSAAAAHIWQHTGATIIPAFVLHLQPGQYGCYAYRPIEMSANETVDENSQRIANVFQTIVREHPEQWFNFVPIWHW